MCNLLWNCCFFCANMSSQQKIFRDLWVNPLVTTTIILLICCIEMMIVLLSSHLENENVELDTSKLLRSAYSCVVCWTAGRPQVPNKNASSPEVQRYVPHSHARIVVCSSGSSWRHYSLDAIVSSFSFFLLLELFLSNCFVYICLFILILLRFL